MTYANTTRTETLQGAQGAHHTHFARLSLPAGAMALRALRPSVHSVRLPVRYLRSYVYSVHCPVPLDAEFWPTREIPVFVKRTRSAYLQH